jgi:DNA-binding XRE family transcriptional regulator
MDESIRAKETGERLRELRANRGQAEVAEAIGVSTMAISQYETGKRIPQDKIKVKLAKYFGQSVESLFFSQKVNS